MSFGVEEVNGNNLDADHADIHDEILPASVVHADRIDVCSEEASTSNEELLDSDTTGTLGEWEKFDQVSICQSIVSDIVPRAVKEDEEKNSDSCCVVRATDFERIHSVLHGNSPCDVYYKHTRCTTQKHCSSLESWRNKSNCSAIDKTPRCVAKIDHRFGVRVCDTNHVKNLAEIESAWSLASEFLMAAMDGKHVRDKGVSTPLCEYSHGRCDKRSAPHSWGRNHISP